MRAGKSGTSLSLDLRDPLLPASGAADAQLAIIEFSDFQCLYCRRHAQRTSPQCAYKYLDAGRVRYFFVDYPLVFHSQASPAAIAGACAHEQDASGRCMTCCWRPEPPRREL